MANTAPSSGHHLAAIIPAKGSSLEISERPTPTPGSEEILVHVKAVALNPVDYCRLHLGAFVETYPATIGNDFSGVIVAKGFNVSDDFLLGTRVAGVSAPIGAGEGRDSSKSKSSDC